MRSRRLSLVTFLTFSNRVQELVLARDAVFVCGSARMWYSKLIEVLQKLEGHELAEASATLRSNPASYLDCILCYRTLSYILQNPELHLSLSTILQMVRSKSASKPDDKVYGLYGVFHEMQLQNLPQVDYDRPVYETFTQIATAAIKNERSLRLLYNTSLPQLISSLPSWVPDWSNSAFYQPSSQYKMDATAFSSSKIEPPTIQADKLTVKGHIIDGIRELATSTSIAMASFRRGYDARLNVHETEQRCTGVLELVRTLQSWIRLSRKIQEYPTKITPRQAFQHTVMENSRLVERLDDENLETALRKWMQIITANFPDSLTTLQTLHNEVQQLPEYQATVADYSHVFEQGLKVEEWPEELQIRLFLRLSNPHVTAMQHDIFLNTYHKTLFVSDDGYMGTCPRWTRAGDFIALISGLLVPFIVRRENEHYRLVGPAYVHGVMHGERWNPKMLEEITFV